MKWLVDKVDTNDMTVRFKSKRKSDKEITYKITLSRNFKEYIKEEGYKTMRFGHDLVNSKSTLALGLSKESQGVNLIGNTGDVRTWFDVTNYIEQYMEEGIEVNFLHNYKFNLRKNGTGLLELEEK